MKFKTLFETQKNQLLYSRKILNEEFTTSRDDMLDETDWTSTELEQSMRMRLRSRESLYMKKMDEALKRISDGTFGQCESCGDDIESKRLEARPTTTLCISCKEDSERKELGHIDGHRSKSLGSRVKMQMIG